MKNKVLSIDQMMYLQRLGLDISKASMHYWVITNGEYSEEVGGYVFSKESSCVTLKLYPYEFMGDSAIRRVEDIPTFIVQDILDLLPRKICINEEQEQWAILKIHFPNEGGWEVSYMGINKCIEYFIHKNLLVASYKMLCWLIEQGYIDPKDK